MLTCPSIVNLQLFILITGVSPFFTTKNKDTSTGLGLTIAEKIIQNHSGYIQFQNNKTKGSTFKIFLPALKYKKTYIEPLKDVAEVFTPNTSEIVEL